MRNRLNALVLAFSLGATSLFAGLTVEGNDENGKKIDVPDPKGKGTTTAKVAGKGPLADALRFEDGDTLHGNLQKIENGIMTWTRPDVQEPIKVKLDNIRGLKLYRNPKGTFTGTKVSLTNGDVLAGEMVSLDTEELTLNTWFAGTLKIPRVMVQSVRPGTKSGEVILNGFGKLSEWGYKSGDWRLGRNKLSGARGQSQIGRNAKLPDKVHIRMNVSWQGSYPGFSIITHTNNIRRYYQDCYNLQISGNYIYLYRGSGNQNLGNLHYNKLGKMRKVELDLYVDRAGKRVALMFDGELVKQWSNLSYAPSGDGFMLISQGSYGGTTFSNMKVSKWDGRLPTSGGTVDVTSKDMIRFVNADKMSGNVIAIKDGKVTLKTAYQPLDVPIQNIFSISFGQEDAERARRNIGDVRAFFPNGSHITMKLKKAEGGKVVGSSENFGTKAFDMSAFIGMEFDIYADREGEENEDSLEELMFGD